MGGGQEGERGGLKMNRRPGGILKGGWGRGANRRGAKKTILSPPSLPPSTASAGPPPPSRLCLRIRGEPSRLSGPRPRKQKFSGWERGRGG